MCQRRVCTEKLEKNVPINADMRDRARTASADFRFAPTQRGYHAQSAYTRRRQIAVVEWLRTKSNKLGGFASSPGKRHACRHLARAAVQTHLPNRELLSLGRWKNGVATPSKPPHSLAVNVESAPAPPAGGGLHTRLGVAFAVVAFAAMALSRCH